MERTTGARKSLPVLGAALAMGLALLFPVGSPAAGGRTAPADPAFVQYLKDARAGDQARTLGLVPAPIAWTAVPRTHFAPMMARFPDRFAPASTSAAASPLVAAEAASGQAGPTPAAYDLRTAGKLSPVRNQGGYGTCWAFASLASLESSLLPGTANDFSENNLAHRSGYSLGYDDGGNSSMAAAYLLRWAGPVSEADDPYAPYAATPNSSPPDAAVGTHVQEVLELPSRRSATDNADLKWAVMTYGAVYTSMCWSESAFRDSAAYYYTGSSSPNHAVALVGWDDTYAASRFGATPAGPGAFLVRNSWGTGFGQNGYFWVSYYDTEFAGDNAVFAGAEPAAASDRIYQHDPLGWVASYRPTGATDPSTAWFAAAYTAAEAGTLTAAGFYATAPNAAYEVRVAASVDGIRDAAASATGTLAVPGYHTVALDAPVAVSAGQPLVIAVRVTVPGYGFPVAVERPWTGYADATAAAGQSFVSGDGVTWTDMTQAIAGTDVCLKGYGSAAAPPDAAPTPAPEPTAPVAPTVRVSDSAAGSGRMARVFYRVGCPDAASTANVRLTISRRNGAVVRRQTLHNVSVGARHTWRVRAPSRRAAYVIVAVAVRDTGTVSKQATATLRVR